MFNSIGIFLISVIILSLSEATERLKIPLSHTSKGELLINAFIGNPSQHIYLKVLTSSKMIWVKNKHIYGTGYDEDKSHNYSIISSPVSLIYKKQKGQCTYLEEELSLISSNHFDITAKNLPIYIANQCDLSNDYDGVLGFGYSSKDKNKTNIDNILKQFLDLGYDQEAINSKVFTITDSLLIFGEYNKYYKKYRYCPMGNDTKANKDKEYRCTVNMIYYIDNNNNKIEYIRIDANDVQYSSVVFATGANVFLLPMTYFNFIVAKVFRNYINNGWCHQSREGYLTFVNCKDSIRNYINDLGEIYFVFGKWSMKYEINKLFREPDQGYMLFEIMNEDTDENRDIWKFGTPLLKSYDIIFDNDDYKIGFVQKE